MGFFSTLGKLMSGKPVFETPKTPKPAGWQPQTPTPQSPQAAGPKQIPQVYVERVECFLNGMNLDCDVVIQNYSHGQILLDRVELLGRSVNLNDTTLNPGQEREFRVYSGPRPNSTANSACRLHYRDASGDYFYSLHTVVFHKLPDGTYSIERIRFLNITDE